METKLLYDNKWIQLKEMSDPAQGIGGYVYSHEVRCNGKIVTILPYRFDNKGAIEFLLRHEVTPCWNPVASEISSITGGVENDDPVTTAIHELKEEAGYEAKVHEMIDLGIMRGIKSSDTYYFLFSVNVTGKLQTEATGDGSELERKAKCFWTKDISDAVDPFVFALYYKLLNDLAG